MFMYVLRLVTFFLKDRFGISVHLLVRDSVLALQNLLTEIETLTENYCTTNAIC